MPRKARLRRPPPLAWRVLVVTLATLATAAVLSLYVLLPAQRARRHQAVAFEGVIAKKQILSSESRRYGSRLRYFLVIREETGELVRFRVPRAMYERALVGMPVRKEAGESLPTMGQP